VKEYAVLRDGEVVTIITTNNQPRAEYLANELEGPDVIVMHVEDVPDKTLERYRFWNERP
jgi:hypothetical protein